MSSAGNSPAGGTPGSTVPAFLRRKTNPLVKKKPASSRPPASVLNGSSAHGTSPAVSSATGSQPKSQPEAELAERIPIVTTKRQLLAGMRHHVIRFVPNSSQSVQQVDPTVESQFQRPIRLHRRDPRINNVGHWEQAGGALEETKPALDDKEKEKLEAQKAMRKAEREAIQAQIAPSAAKVKKDRFKHKTEQVFQKSETKQHGVDMRYQETIPWHLEDFEDKNIWQGQYEEPLSNCHVMFIPGTDAQGGRVFRMVPVEKWYKFAPKNLFQSLTIEEAERRMAKANKPSRWFMETQKKLNKERQTNMPVSKMYTRHGKRTEKAAAAREGGGGDDDDEMFGGSEGEEGADEMDFDHDEEFQDDDENALFEGDEEETKEAEAKVKRERNEANIFDVKEQRDWDAEEVAEKERLKKSKKDERRTKRALMKREKNYIYEDDSDENPYASEESEDSEEEHIKEEEQERKKLEEETAAVKEEPKPGDKATPATASSSAASAAAAAAAAPLPSSQGNTPSARPEKKDALKKSLKRPGSPNLSETSGNESSTTRKKLKKKHLQKSGLSAGATMSRPASPAGSQSPRPGANGVTAGSDGETSDHAPLKSKIKLKLMQGGSRAASPTGSRAGSPSAPASGASPPSTTASAVPKKEPALPSPEELIAAVPPEGLVVSALVQKFKASRGHPDFGKFIKANLRSQKRTVDGKTEMWLYRKDEATKAA